MRVDGREFPHGEEKGKWSGGGGSLTYILADGVIEMEEYLTKCNYRNCRVIVIAEMGKRQKDGGIEMD